MTLFMDCISVVCRVILLGGLLEPSCLVVDWSNVNTTDSTEIVSRLSNFEINDFKQHHTWNWQTYTPGVTYRVLSSRYLNGDAFILLRFQAFLSSNLRTQGNELDLTGFGRSKILVEWFDFAIILQHQQKIDVPFSASSWLLSISRKAPSKPIPYMIVSR